VVMVLFLLTDCVVYLKVGTPIITQTATEINARHFLCGSSRNWKDNFGEGDS